MRMATHSQRGVIRAIRSPAARRLRLGLLFVSPWIIGYCVFYLYPFLATIYYSFTSFTGIGNPVFTGLSNYDGLLHDALFRTAVYNPWLIILGLSLLQGIMHLVPDVLTMVEGMLVTGLELSAVYLAARLALRLLFQWQPLRMAVDTLKLALPHAGTIFRNLAAARWARSFTTLWSSGVAVSYALEVSSRSALNARYERALRQAARQTRQGWTLRQSLAGADLLPRYLLDMIGTGEESGKLGDALDRFVTLMEEEAYTRAAQEFMFIITIGQILLIVIAVVGVMH